MIIRTEAVVLRSMDYSETSQIVTLFTREKGKLAVLAKGARRAKSRFGSSLQPLSYTQVVFYHKPTRGLQTLSESAHVQPLHHIRRDLEKITVGLRIVELVNALMQEEEQNPLLFNLLLQALYALNEAQRHAANVLPYFQLRLAAALGFAPSIEREAVQHLPEEGGQLLLDTGAVLAASNPPGTSRPASRATLRAYAICARADLATVMRMRLAPEVRQELDHLVEAFLRYHVQDAYPVRSSKVMEQMFGSTLPGAERES